MSVNLPNPTSPPTPVQGYPPPSYWLPPEDDTIDLLELFQTLWRWKVLILALTVLGLVSSYGIVQVLPRQYTAEVIYVAGSTGAITNRGVAEFQLQNEILRTSGDPRFLLSLVQQDNLAPLLLGSALNAAGQFIEPSPLSPEEAAVEVLLSEKSEVLSFDEDIRGNLLLTVKLPDAQSAADLANSFLQKAEQWAMSSLSERYQNEIRLLEAQLALQDEQRALKLKEVLAFLQEHPNVVNPDYINPTLISMQDRLAEIDVDLALGGNNQATLETQRERLATRIKELQVEQNQEALRQQEFAQKQKELESSVEVAVDLSKQLELKKSELVSRQAQTVQLLSVARPPEEPSSPRALLIIVLSGMVSLFASVFLVFLIEFVQNLRNQSQDSATA